MLSNRLSSSSSIFEKVYVAIPFLATLLLVSILVSNIYSGRSIVDDVDNYGKFSTYTEFYENHYIVSNSLVLEIRKNIYVSGCMFSENNSLFLSIIYMPSKQSSEVINVTVVKVRIHGVEHYIGLNISRGVNRFFISINNIDSTKNTPAIVWFSVYDKLFYRIVFINSECHNIYYRK